MKVVLDSPTIQSINYFQNITGSSVVDCIVENGEIYFVVAQGQYGLSVGKGGAKVRNAEKLFKKTIHIIEYAPDAKEFIKNVIPEAQSVELSGTEIEVRVRPQDRARAIGKAGRNIKILNRLLERLFGVTARVK